MMKKLFLLAATAFLFACFTDKDDPPELVTQGMVTILEAQSDFSEDSVIYLADSVKFVDELGQVAKFNKDNKSGLYYSAWAKSSSINIGFNVIPNSDGGRIEVSCHPNTDQTVSFTRPVFPVKRYGFSLSFKDSLKAGDSTFYDVVEFKNYDTLYHDCNIHAFYFGIHDGLVKVVSKNGVELNRVSAKVYKKAEKRREEERARADSIAQAVADSIAQAVADSIIKANSTAETDTSEEDSVENEIPKEIIDLADSVAECIKKAYSSGSINAIKECSKIADL